jgi:hypothetical protein
MTHANTTTAEEIRALLDKWAFKLAGSDGTDGRMILLTVCIGGCHARIDADRSDEVPESSWAAVTAMCFCDETCDRWAPRRPESAREILGEKNWASVQEDLQSVPNNLRRAAEQAEWQRFERERIRAEEKARLEAEQRIREKVFTAARQKVINFWATLTLIAPLETLRELAKLAVSQRNLEGTTERDRPDTMRGFIGRHLGFSGRDRELRQLLEKAFPNEALMKLWDAFVREAAQHRFDLDQRILFDPTVAAKRAARAAKREAAEKDLK